jgi:hypothetical protein
MFGVLPFEVKVIFVMEYQCILYQRASRIIYWHRS